ncbi:hypothetical protein EVAR_68107_1 [Eumeta japonica]|uniref:Uncharacterized protein n=1 Tax=Eumeta variegata TaxID=151549 RepID=A0A4C1ZFG7_EUMVA|nr:hypothetical protein EVAR_68107_1 [Eumeta japonica]
MSKLPYQQGSTKHQPAAARWAARATAAILRYMGGRGGRARRTDSPKTYRDLWSSLRNINQFRYFALFQRLQLKVRTRARRAGVSARPQPFLSPGAADERVTKVRAAPAAARRNYN